jgi:hypothetical protein
VGFEIRLHGGAILTSCAGMIRLET